MIRIQRVPAFLLAFILGVALTRLLTSHSFPPPPPIRQELRAAACAPCAPIAPSGCASVAPVAPLSCTACAPVAPVAPVSCPVCASAAAIPPVSALALRQRLDEQPIHVLHVICGGHVPRQDVGFDALTVVKSILQARAVGASRRRRYHIHIVTDARFHELLGEEDEVCAEECAMRNEMHDVLDYAANMTGGRVIVTFYDLERDVLAPTAAAVGAAADVMSNTVFKLCSSVRLKIPFIAGPIVNADRVLYTDSDVIVRCDLETLWEAEFPAMEAPGAAPPPPPLCLAAAPLFAFAEEAPHRFYPTAYRHLSPDLKYPSRYESGLNAGIFLARLDRWRAVRAEYWRHVVEIVSTGGYTAYNLSVDGGGGLTYGDQCLLNILSARVPQWFTVLPGMYNSRAASQEAGMSGVRQGACGRRHAHCRRARRAQCQAFSARPPTCNHPPLPTPTPTPPVPQALP